MDLFPVEPTERPAMQAVRTNPGLEESGHNVCEGIRIKSPLSDSLIFHCFFFQIGFVIFMNFIIFNLL